MKIVTTMKKHFINFSTLSILLIALFTGTIFLSCNDDNEEKEEVIPTMQTWECNLNLGYTHDGTTYYNYKGIITIDVYPKENKYNSTVNRETGNWEVLFENGEWVYYQISHDTLFVTQVDNQSGTQYAEEPVMLWKIEKTSDTTMTLHSIYQGLIIPETIIDYNFTLKNTIL